MKAKLVCGLIAAFCAAGFAEDWKPVPGGLMTRWAKDVNPSNPLPEYPRPQMVRKEWTNLNGLWDYAIVPLDSPQPSQFDGKILVPFPVESALSGVKKPLTDKQRLWYRRTFTVPKLSGKRLLLNFGAVDWEAKVFVNSKPVGEHRGGYDAFTFDITDAVKPGNDNELVVSVFDSTGGYQPKGKQHFPAIANPGGIMYTPCSGIWQTVWLETVPAAYIEGLRITPDLDNNQVEVTTTGAGAKSKVKVQVSVLDGDKVVAKASGVQNSKITLSIPKPKLWSPDSPFLYSLKIKYLNDEVTSYFGMRKIAIGKDEKGITRPMLNGKFVFQSGPLDQGFWPDGIYTAPTDEALRYDIEVTKKLGFNMARKHVKVEPDRWYYWCDKLGLLVWQDMPSADASKGNTGEKDGVPISVEAGKQFEAELRAMVEQHANHPSIILWVVFNEAWGQHDTPRLTKWVKELDPTRLVNNASGWNDRQCGDVIDMHIYPGPGSPQPEPNRAAVLGEFGGLGFAIPGHTWTQQTWGYQGMGSQKALTRKYCELWQKVWQLKDNPGLSAAVYTQTTDVETECNGLLTYDRAVIKPSLAAAASVTSTGTIPPTPQYRVIVPTSQDQPATWRYTTDKPADDWFKPNFDASAWKEGPGGFGNGEAPNTHPRTPWKTSDIWLRREVTLPTVLPKTPLFRVYNDEDVQIYVNGVLAAKATGYVVNYEDLKLDPKGVVAFKPGKNLIAVHCHQTVGGQFIDVGLVEERPAK